MNASRTRAFGLAVLLLTSAAFVLPAAAAARNVVLVHGALVDKTQNPDLQRSMDKHAGDKIAEIKGSRALYISQNKAAAKVIETAARAVD